MPYFGEINLYPESRMKKTAITFAILLSFAGYTWAEIPETLKGVAEYQDLFNNTMHAGVACYRIPAIVTAPNGDLVVAIDERVPSCSDLGRNKDINIVMRRSSDDGKTWSEIETVVDYPHGKSASDPSMIVDEVTDKIFLFYNYIKG